MEAEANETVLFYDFFLIHCSVPFRDTVLVSLVPYSSVLFHFQRSDILYSVPFSDVLDAHSWNAAYPHQAFFSQFPTCAAFLLPRHKG